MYFRGLKFAEEEKDAVFSRAQFISDWHEARGYRFDKCGALIRRIEHGNRNSNCGWEIDHIKPRSQGGTDSIENYQPLHWKNNMAKNDKEETICQVHYDINFGNVETKAFSAEMRALQAMIARKNRNTHIGIHKYP